MFYINIAGAGGIMHTFDISPRAAWNSSAGCRLPTNVVSGTLPRYHATTLPRYHAPPGPADNIILNMI